MLGTENNGAHNPILWRKKIQVADSIGYVIKVVRRIMGQL